LKFFFVEGGEQFIVGIQTAKKIGLKETIRITVAGISFATILFFLLFYSRALISTRWLELALGITLYFFAASMFKEVLEKEHEEKEFDEKVHKYGYITIVSLAWGSRNVLAKSLDLPDGIVECCQRFVNAKPLKIDVISALITTAAAAPPAAANDYPKEATTRIFLNAAEIGVGAEIIDRSKKIRDKIKSRFISTISGIIATLPTYESNLCEVSIDDGRQSLLSKITMGIVANGRYLGGGFKAAPQASVSDGLLDITILKNSGSLKMLDEFVNMKGDADYIHEQNDIFYMQAKKVSIKSKERDITVTLDGEPIGILPATFHVYQKALSIKF
jgi:diacylglycerol kinase family enzyme